MQYKYITYNPRIIYISQLVYINKKAQCYRKILFAEAAGRLVIYI